MNLRIIHSCALALMLLGCAMAQAQDNGLMPVGTLDGLPGVPLPAEEGGAQNQSDNYVTPASLPIDPAAPAPMPNDGSSATVVRQPGRPSDWLVGVRPDCCGPIGGNGPLSTELYLRNGVSFAIGGPILSRSLEPGWVIQGGGRLLCFNVEENAAWTVDLGINNICNHGRGNVQIPLPGATVTPVTISNLNRTSVNVAFGRECYLLGKHGCGGPSWRIGVDAGGRYGTEKMEFNQIRHRTDVLGGPVVAVHTDLEIPKGPCIFQVGLRGELDYIWMNILQGNNSQVMDANLLLTLGVRF